MNKYRIETYRLHIELRFGKDFVARRDFPVKFPDETDLLTIFNEPANKAVIDSFVCLAERANAGLRYA